MTNSLTPRVRADIINYDPTQPGALSVTEFCRSLKVSRSVFYKIRTWSQHESTAAGVSNTQIATLPGSPVLT